MQVCNGFVKLCVKISLRQSKATTGIRKSRMHEVPTSCSCQYHSWGTVVFADVFNKIVTSYGPKK